jgi:hypothetical protein
VDLRASVQALAEGIGARHAGSPQTLRKARDWLEQRLQRIAQTTSGDGSGTAGGTYWAEDLGSEGHHAENLIVDLPSQSGRVDGPRLVLGAHYDTEPQTPGANDNASGVALALELAWALAREPAAAPVRIALFANEEQPYFGTEAMGSLVHARRARARGEPLCGMISLETLGYFTDEPDSQGYPWPLGAFYPSTGNFVAFVGNFASRGLLTRTVAAFRQSVVFPSEAAALPEFLPGVGWSDHWAFWRAGYPALMVTDTAVFRDPHYHRPTDRPENLDYLRLARLTEGLLAAVRKVAEGCAE